MREEPPVLAAIARRVQVLAPGSFRVGRQETSISDAMPPARTSPLFHPDPLLYSLRLALYQTFQMRSNGRRTAAGAEETTELAQRLIQARGATKQMDSGWAVLTLQADGSIVVEKDGRVRKAAAGEYLHAGAPAPPREGSPVALAGQRTTHHVQEGYVHVFGAWLADIESEQQRVRFYWNVAPGGAARLVRNLATSLDRYAVPFAFKCPDHPRRYRRADTAVLYVGARYVPLASELVRDICASIAPHMRSATPFFARRLTAGLAVGYDPGGGQSLGGHRSLIAAEGLVDAFRKGAVAPAQRLEVLETAFRECGLDPRRPYLLAGPRDPAGLAGLWNVP